MGVNAQLFVDGLATGLVFVILATGLVLITSVNKILFMAYGAFYTIGAYATWYAVNYLRLPYFGALLVGSLALPDSSAYCATILVFRRLLKLEGGFLASLIASMGLMMILSQGGVLVFGTQVKSIPSVFTGILEFGGVSLSKAKLALIIMGILITVLLFVVYEKSSFGRSMRAVAFHREAAAMQGINADRIFLLVLGLGTAIAGFGGGAIAPVYGINPQMGYYGGLDRHAHADAGRHGQPPGCRRRGVRHRPAAEFRPVLHRQRHPVDHLRGDRHRPVLQAQWPARPGPRHRGVTMPQKPILTGKLFWVVVAVAVVAALCVPLFVHSPYYLDLVIIVMVNAVLAMTFILTLRAGLINLGLVSFWGIGAYASAILTSKLGLSFWLALPAATLITAFVALLLGFVLIGSGSSGFTFVILSAVVGMIFATLVGSIAWLGGYNGISNIPAPDTLHLGFATIDFTSSKVPFFYLGLGLMLLVMLVFRALYSGWAGRAWTAIGLNPRLAESVGVNLTRYKILAFVVSSAAAGLIGSFYANYEGFVTPTTFSMWQNIYVQCYAILGGIAFPLLGPIVGAGVMTILPEAMRIASVWAPVVTGAILVLLILFFPYGLLGLIRDPLVAILETRNRARAVGRGVKTEGEA